MKGSDKNKKLFAPKVSKRKDRKDRKAHATKSTADVSLADAPPPAINEANQEAYTTSKAVKKPVAARTADSSLAAVKIQPVPATVNSIEKEFTSIDPKHEPLTEEELAINASASRRNRRRPSHEQPDPVSAPSPMSPINKPDCTFERQTSDVPPFLKIERTTPDAKKRLCDITEESQHPTEDTTAENLVPIRQESVVPKIDLEDNNMDYSDLLASGEDDDVDVDGDVHVERLLPVYIDTGSPSADTDSKKSQKRLASKRSLRRSSRSSTSLIPKATRHTSEEEESDQLDEDDDEKEKEEKQLKPAVKKRKIKPSTRKGKGKEKEKPVAKKNSTASSKSAKKGGATAVSIGISIPTTSASTSAASSDGAKADKNDGGEEEYSDIDSDGNRVVRTRKKKQKSRVKKHKYAYRLVENMKTLDDITNDPTSVDNLQKPMYSFTKDIDGIVSRTFKDMETQKVEAKRKKELRNKMSEEELEALKKKEAEEERIAKEKREAAKAKEEEKRRKEQERKMLVESSNALQVRLVNGEIVLDTDSLVVERREGGANYGDDPMEIVEESSTTKKVNSSTYGKRKQSSRWDDLETALFYDCLSQFGTDFEMIANMIPGRNRSQIRTKFNREEKLCPEKVTEYMITKRKPMDLDKYKEVTGIELETVPDDFHEMQLA
ncbi:hypothetical protein [Parasitella parasitica]|uniref:Myb-like domain-containing protein n=1 Tax=Parasitella parasitica TaxID=35722 RepID=A0A0B7NHL3_9FUNG|nr:hypothetical protein [Parasitella parasitica]